MSIVDDYLNTLSPPQRDELARIRSIINQVIPEATEVISYGMPAFNYKGEYLIGFYVSKNHMSLFPTAGPINAMKNKLGAFKLSKGTIQFTINNPISNSIIKDILLYRVDSIDKI